MGQPAGFEPATFRIYRVLYQTELWPHYLIPVEPIRLRASGSSVRQGFEPAPQVVQKIQTGMLLQRLCQPAVFMDKIL